MSERSVTIGLDAMGGDRGPSVVVAGARAALERARGPLNLVLVGDPEVLGPELDGFPRPLAERIAIEPSVGVVGMSESPAAVVRSRVRSSIHVLAELGGAGRVDAVISAGNTGAVMALCRQHFGMLPGVDRPAIAAFIPRPGDPCLVLDVGANATCRGDQLVGFAVMGSVYAQRVLDRREPAVGLLSMGEEAEKGTPEIRLAHGRLSESPLRFVGNVEGRDLLLPGVDVVVCDGFVGNVLLKFAEEAFRVVGQRLEDRSHESVRGRLVRRLLGSEIGELTADLDPEVHGGAPLLGVDGAVIICHGNAGPRAVEEAIFAAMRHASLNVNQEISDLMGRMSAAGPDPQSD